MHSSSRKTLIHRSNLIPTIDERIAELAGSDKVDDARSCEGLKALREWILIHCRILHESGFRQDAYVLPDPYERPQEYAPQEIMNDLEMLSFSGTPRRAAAIYRTIAAKGISPKEDFILRRYLDLDIPENLEPHALMTDEEYFRCFAGIAPQLPEDAK